MYVVSVEKEPCSKSNIKKTTNASRIKSHGEASLECYRTVGQLWENHLFLLTWAEDECPTLRITRFAILTSKVKRKCSTSERSVTSRKSFAQLHVSNVKRGGRENEACMYQTVKSIVSSDVTLRRRIKAPGASR